MTADQTWRERAACREHVSLFDATHVNGRPADRTRHDMTAISICHTCPVETDCLTDALDVETPSTRYGIRGGMTPRERNNLHRRSTRKDRT